MNMDFLPHWALPLIIALVTGLLIGLELRAGGAEAAKPYDGLRVLPLVTIGGFVSVFWWPSQPVFLVGLAVLGVLLTANFVRHSQMTGASGVAMEVVMITAWLLGGMAATGESIAPLVIAVVVTMLLSTRKGERGRSTERVVMLKFALLTLVISFLLPNENYTVFQINPRQVWAMIVLVAAISSVGYFGVRLFGPRRGLFITALCGGLVSSTAVALVCVRLAQQKPALIPRLAGVIVLASSVMMVRQIIEVMVLQPGLTPMVMALLMPPLVAGIWISARMLRGAPGEELPLSNPLELSTALQFGALYGVLLALLQIAMQHVGVVGGYVVTLLASLMDVDAITLALAHLQAQGVLPASAVVLAIAVAALGNTVSKLVMVWFLADRDLAKRTAVGLGGLMAITLIAIGGYIVLAWRATGSISA